ncbi:GTPase ObgE [Candidatus Obscuribacterales bacterium]|nr:GTPase ObgE [Candidatus Obscuribacterales bacterium]MBX3136033.1 GTPase ObgE [Candidatus Obscuribacterales bacterium]MBX3148813.1 GTPase ObgE [Candidatus Obscuribacterales bacterium]
MTQFIDETEIVVRSGDGGNGMVAWRREKYEPLGGPAGGNGGKGGDIYLKAVGDKSTLLDFRYKTEYEAEPGAKGGPKNRHGRGGNDLIIEVPVGTIAYDVETGNAIADLTHDGLTIMVAQGGKGGRGNTSLATQQRRAPHFCEPGLRGVERRLKLELKLLADVGIVGLPNAGKSTLLSVLTAAKPKIADYPFTTLSPQLGVVKMADGQGFVMADIPGLIEGASQGLGLGHKFLKHIERTRFLIHLVDISSENLQHDIETIDKELAGYGTKLKTLPQIMVLNKIDLVDDDATTNAINLVKKMKPDSPVLTISGAISEGTRELINLVTEKLAKSREEEPDELFEGDVLPPDEDAYAETRSNSYFEIHRKKNVFTIEGDRAERLVEVTNMRDTESLQHLYRAFRSMGVIDALIAEGIQSGQTIKIAGVEFTYGEDW